MVHMFYVGLFVISPTLLNMFSVMVIFDTILTGSYVDNYVHFNSYICDLYVFKVYF